jgi:hypothetical protein
MKSRRSLIGSRESKVCFLSCVRASILSSLTLLWVLLPLSAVEDTAAACAAGDSSSSTSAAGAGKVSAKAGVFPFLRTYQHPISYRLTLHLNISAGLAGKRKRKACQLDDVVMDCDGDDGECGSTAGRSRVAAPAVQHLAQGTTFVNILQAESTAAVSCSQKIIERFNLVLAYKDFWLLRNGKWLNDEVRVRFKASIIEYILIANIMILLRRYMLVFPGYKFLVRYAPGEGLFLVREGC